MNAAEWNSLFFEERMSYLDNQPQSKAPAGEIWRRVSPDIIVSHEANVKQISMKNFMNKRFEKGVDINNRYSVEERMAMCHEAFPLQKEVRDDSTNRRGCSSL